MNLYHLLDELGGGEEWNVDLENEVIRGSIVLNQGEMLWPPPRIEPSPKPKEEPSPEPQQEVQKSTQRIEWLLETYFGTGSGYCIYTDRYVWSVRICTAILQYLYCLVS